jgi:hypothetical protein
MGNRALAMGAQTQGGTGLHATAFNAARSCRAIEEDRVSARAKNVAPYKLSLYPYFSFCLDADHRRIGAEEFSKEKLMQATNIFFLHRIEV